MVHKAQHNSLKSVTFHREVDTTPYGKGIIKYIEKYISLWHQYNVLRHIHLYQLLSLSDIAKHITCRWNICLYPYNVGYIMHISTILCSTFHFWRGKTSIPHLLSRNASLLVHGSLLRSMCDVCISILVRLFSNHSMYTCIWALPFSWTSIHRVTGNDDFHWLQRINALAFVGAPVKHV